MSLPEAQEEQGPVCSGGECVSQAPLGWQGPVWLWSGPEANAPPCPEDASALTYEGHADLRTSGSCDACACTTPECGFPEGVRISSAGPDCVGPLADILVPPNWDGSCFSFPPVANPISVFFRRSTRSECVPLVSEIAKHVTFSWDTFARACTPIAVPESCPATPKDCATRPPQGFAQCLFREGDPSTCPADYPELRRFHGAVDDQSSCTPCSCQLPEESNCRVFMSLDTTTGCKFGGQGTVVGPAHEGCMTNHGPSQYASLRGEIKETEPDVCMVGGGEFAGEILPAQPTTFCCKAE
ncbi:hypothetical protein [Chondromyces apiculatus]|nr:hypothetical protein [Chondromyces apiculatus]